MVNVGGGNVFVMLVLVVLHVKHKSMQKTVAVTTVAVGMVFVKRVHVFVKHSTVERIAVNRWIFTKPPHCGRMLKKNTKQKHNTKPVGVREPLVSVHCALSLALVRQWWQQNIEDRARETRCVR